MLIKANNSFLKCYKSDFVWNIIINFFSYFQSSTKFVGCCGSFDLYSFCHELDARFTFDCHSQFTYSSIKYWNIMLKLISSTYLILLFFLVLRFVLLFCRYIENVPVIIFILLLYIYTHFLVYFTLNIENNTETRVTRVGWIVLRKLNQFLISCKCIEMMERNRKKKSAIEWWEKKKRRKQMTYSAFVIFIIFIYSMTKMK